MLNSHLIAHTRPQTLPQNTVCHGDIRVSVLTDRLFRIEQDADRKFCDAATQSIWFRDLPPVTFKATVKNGVLTVKTDRAVLTVKDDPRTATVRIEGKTVKLSAVENLPGAYRSLDCCNGEIYIDAKTGEKSKVRLEDGIVSKCGVGIHDDTHSLILTDDGKLCPREDDSCDLYVFAYGKDFRGAIRALFEISGKVPMIPRYAFGNWWSRYHAYTDKEYLHILDKLSDRDIPLTVATIDMDWHWSTTLDERKKITEQGKNDDFHGGAKGWTGYSWNTDLFPDYRAFLQKIKDRDLKITLNLHPARGVRYFEDMYKEMAEAMGIDPATEQRVDFDFTSDDFINAYFKILHKPYEKDGVEFWWIDWQQGTQTATPGLDPLWALNHYHTLDHASDHTPLILSRYCGIGSHRYPLGFSGDTYMTWDSLGYIPYFTAMGTNAGYTWWSHDIGGHMHGIKDDELYARYIQFGVFSPINRLHCANGTLMTKEPMVYMNGTGLVAEEFLRLRHRMIPYLYSASYDTHEKGSALIEPMYYAYPDEADAYRCRGQYLFGGDMIVAPIAKPGDSKGMTAMKVWLPEGRWTDIFTGDEYTGGRWVEIVRWLDTIPVLAKAGSFFLLDGRHHTNSVANPDRMNVMVFNGNGEYTLHEDLEGSWMHTHFTSCEDCGKQTVTLRAEGDFNVVPQRAYRLEFRNIPDGEVTVYANGVKVDVETDVGEYLSVLLPASASNTEYRVEVVYNRTEEEYRISRLLYSMMRFENDHHVKSVIRRKLTACESKEEFIQAVNESAELTKNEKKRLVETL